MELSLTDFNLNKNAQNKIKLTKNVWSVFSKPSSALVGSIFQLSVGTVLFRSSQTQL